MIGRIAALAALMLVTGTGCGRPCRRAGQGRLSGIPVPRKGAARRGRCNGGEARQTVIAARMIHLCLRREVRRSNHRRQGFSGEFFERQWRGAVEHDMIDATPTRKRSSKALLGRPPGDRQQPGPSQRQGHWLEAPPAGQVGTRNGPGVHGPAPASSSSSPAAPIAAPSLCLTRWNSALCSTSSMRGRARQPRAASPPWASRPCIATWTDPPAPGPAWACHGKRGRTRHAGLSQRMAWRPAT